MFDSIADFGHYPEFCKSSIVNHCRRHVYMCTKRALILHAITPCAKISSLATQDYMCTYIDKSKQMDETEVNDRTESLRRRRREFYRVRMEEKHQKKQKQVRYIHVALHHIKLPLGPRLNRMCISNSSYYFVHIPLSMPLTFYYQACHTMLLKSA